MKIVNVIFESRLGGPQYRIAEVARNLKQRFKIHTLVLMPEADSKYFCRLLSEYEVEYMTKQIHCLSRKAFALIKWAIFLIPEIIRIAKVIKRQRPDIVHCNGSWQWKGVIAARFSGTKVVWHLNDTFVPWVVKQIFKILAKQANGFIVAGNRVRDYYLNEFTINKPIMTIQAPVNTHRYNPDFVKGKDKIQNHQGIKIVTVANINPSKGIEYFLEVARLLNQTYKNLGFFVVGGLFESQKKYIGKIKEKILANRLTNVCLWGMESDIAAVLKSCDIFVCTSLFEASPMAVWEAMAMGKAIVSTDVGSVADFIKDGKNGFVVPIKNSPLLARRTGQLIENPLLRKEFGQQARLCAQHKLDVNVISNQYDDFYRSL